VVVMFVRGKVAEDVVRSYEQVGSVELLVELVVAVEIDVRYELVELAEAMVHEQMVLERGSLRVAECCHIRTAQNRLGVVRRSTNRK
jgi:hypothetical protein